MCGIVGLVDKRVDQAVLKRMCDSMRHRGPDGEGQEVIFAPGHEIGLGHRRLAIIDLSERAKQPMWDTDRKVCIVYNGEVYNFCELRAELEKTGHTFASTSDTEVVLQAYMEWGIDCVRRLNGMFAFALWDYRNGGKLILARDRYGIKPLYYCSDPGRFVLGSEVKAILAAGIKPTLDYAALSEYFTFQNLFTDRTLFEGIKMLPPGTILEIDCSSTVLPPKITRYWDFSRETTRITEPEALDHLKSLFVRAVERQLVSDVPVGSYLSGGMDTGSITTVASAHLPRMSTFTCGFDMHSVSGLELGFDERRHSEFLANLLKTEHYETVLHAGDMEAVLPDLVWHLEDLRVGQCYPDWYASRLASRFVKVVLSGAGGDELFAGYPWRYFHGGVGSAYIESYYNFWQRLVTSQDREWFFNYDTYAKVKDSNPFDIFRGVFEEVPLDTKSEQVKAALIFELKTFLRGLLVVTDKVSMAHSLETRLPFLDNDLVDFALSLPIEYHLKRLDAKTVDENDIAKPKRYYQKTNEGKHLLRLAMRELLPQEVLEREKQGFSAPDGSWYRGESVDYVRRLLLDKKARIFDYLNYPYVQRVIESHVVGRKNNRLLIWSLLCFEWWLQRFIP